MNRNRPVDIRLSIDDLVAVRKGVANGRGLMNQAQVFGKGWKQGLLNHSFEGHKVGPCVVEGQVEKCTDIYIDLSGRRLYCHASRAAASAQGR